MPPETETETETETEAEAPITISSVIIHNSRVLLIPTTIITDSDSDSDSDSNSNSSSGDGDGSSGSTTTTTTAAAIRRKDVFHPLDLSLLSSLEYNRIGRTLASIMNNATGSGGGGRRDLIERISAFLGIYRSSSSSSYN